MTGSKGRHWTAIPTLALYAATALAESAGCLAVWALARNGASGLWHGPGLLSLALFAWLLTRSEADLAGRAYAAYGGIYIAASLVWLWAVEGQRPDRWDVTGIVICLIGAGVILLGPRGLNLAEGRPKAPRLRHPQGSTDQR